MTPRRPHPRAAVIAAIVLPVLAPGALALATGHRNADATTPPSSPPVLVAEQVATARHIVPFAIAGAHGERRTIWAFGRTRAASRLVGTTPTAPPPTSPESAVLLQGTASTDSSPTAWARAAPPLDVTGAPLAPGTWRPADGTDAPTAGPAPDAATAMHSGQGTERGAAALLVRIVPPGGSGARTAVLARTADGRFRELPAPPDELVAPATSAFAGPADALAPFAVADAAAANPSDSQPDRGRTAVLLAPAGGDGVLRWDGARWSEEPWVDSDGNAAGPRTPLDLAATPAGDAVALFAGDATSETAPRVRLARRDPAAKRFAPVTLTGSTLLDGTLPANVRAITPAGAPGTALTIAPKHWWIDLLVTRNDDARVSATVHVRPPGVREPGTTPATTPETTPSTPATSGETTPPSTSPASTTPDATSPSTPTTPEPTTPTDATATGAWCSPTLPGSTVCDHDLGFRFATGRGWTSAAFDGPGRFGERAISSPVIPEATGETTPREASASGGFLELDGTRFALRSGVGDNGTNDTQAARFAPGGFAVVGGVKAVGRTLTRGSERAEAVEQNGPGNPDGALDIAVSPPGTPPSEAGAFSLSVGMGLMRQQGTEDWSWIEFGVSDLNRDRDGSERRAAPAALVWATPNRLILVGPAGLLLELEPPTPFRPYQNSSMSFRYDRVDVGDADLLDVAANGDHAMAVGRDGAAWQRNDGKWTRVAVPDALRDTPLTSVAYAGDEPIVASPAGVLRRSATTGALELDAELAKLMQEDGRPASAEVVAGLADGTAVVDGRYVRTGAGRPWQRLRAPIEGDVIALGLWRDGDRPSAAAPTPTPEAPSGTTTTPAIETTPEPSPGPTSVATPEELGTLRIAASVADVRRGTQGLVREIRTGPENKDVYTYEEPPVVDEGRLVELGPDGWVDRNRTPVARSNGRDLAAHTPPITAISTDDQGNGWVAGGVGSLYDVETDRMPTEIPEMFVAPLGQTLLDQRPADERPISDRARQRADVPATTEPAPSPQPDSEPAVARVLVGGHPACLSECAGRGDQGLGPDATLDDALVTAEKVRALGQGTAPSLMVIGGGRASETGSAGDGLSRAGAQHYLDLLRAHPTVPAVIAIGSGDAATKESREHFAEAARELLRERLSSSGTISAPPEPVAPIDLPLSTTVAYAIDVSARASSVRVIAVDNAGGTLLGGADGPQGRWLTQTLENAEQAGMRTIVVGAARLDGAGGKQADDREDELSLLGRAGADAYIATDGPDDTTDPYFGEQTVRYPADTAHGGRLALYRTAALGHQRQRGLFAGFDDEQADEPDAQIGWTQPALLDVTIGPAPAPDVALLPVLTSMVAQDVNLAAGSAETMFTIGRTRATTGMQIPRPTDHPTPIVPEAPGQVEGAPEIPTETSPGIDPDAPSPTPAPGGMTPDLVDTRAPGWTYAAPPPCRLFGEDDACRGQVPVDVTYEVADPSIAVFVRARPQRGNKPPLIVADEHGDPVIDPTSGVLCPLRPGRTTIIVRVSGRTATYPTRVWPGGQGRPAASANGKQAPCAFRWASTTSSKDEEQTPAPSPAPAPPAVVEPGPQPQPAPRPDPIVRVLSPRPLPPLVAAAPFAAYGLPNAAAPPVAPNPKPAAPGAPPAPPSGVSTQQVPVHQSSVQIQGAAVQQTVGVTAEERRTEVAREGADYRASALTHHSPRTAAQESAAGPRSAGARQAPTLPEGPTYRPAPGTPVATLVGGSLLAALTALAGAAAGRRRRRALARRRSWLR